MTKGMKKTIHVDEIVDLSKVVFEMRPDSSFYKLSSGKILRYANGEWIEDDGQYDLAFLTVDKGHGFSMGLSLPYRKNIRWSWYDQSWTSYDDRHPAGNAWHYMLATGKSDMDASWDRDRHPNQIACESSFTYLRNLGVGSISGRSYEFNPTSVLDLKIKGSGQIVLPPKRPVCIRCADPKRMESELIRIENLIKRHIKSSADESDAKANIEDMINRILEEND